ncbi:acyl carrier protein [Candidatus Woesebacteria bacterium]|nr:acyl carrier protein [Candidatus Woesebacteria bacterium]
MQKNQATEKILSLLATHLGIETQDIDLTDDLSEDLHMSSVDLADFAHNLEAGGFSITPEEISNFDTVGELVEFLAQEEAI